MPIDITTRQLAEFAAKPDLELWVGPQGDGPQVTLQTKEGSWGGRVMRNLKIGVLKEDRTGKREAYKKATEAVLAALKRTYGDEIGEKAFRAGKGRAIGNGGWEFSSDHPITGRHIARMIEAAEAQLRGEDPYEVSRFERRFFRGEKGEPMTKAPVLTWFQNWANRGERLSKDNWREALADPENRGRLRRLEHQGQSGTPGFERLRFVADPRTVKGDHGRFAQGLEATDAIARNLLTDAEARVNQEPDSVQDFWQLGVGKPGGRAGASSASASTATIPIPCTFSTPTAARSRSRRRSLPGG